MNTTKSHITGIRAMISILLTLFASSGDLYSQAEVTNTYTFQYSPQADTWANQTFTLPQFNSSTGLLTGISIQYFCQVSCQYFALDNSSSSSEYVSVSFTNLFDATMPGINYKEGGTLSGSGSVSKGSGYSFIPVSPSTIDVVALPVPIQQSSWGSYIGTNTVQGTLTWYNGLMYVCGTGKCTGIAGSLDNWQIFTVVYLNYQFIPYPPFMVLISSNDATNGTWLLIWNAISNATYVVETSEDLSRNIWNPALTNFSPNAMGSALVNANSNGINSEYYRVRVKVQ